MGWILLLIRGLVSRRTHEKKTSKEHQEKQEGGGVASTITSTTTMTTAKGLFSRQLCWFRAASPQKERLLLVSMSQNFHCRNDVLDWTYKGVLKVLALVPKSISERCILGCWRQNWNQIPQSRTSRTRVWSPLNPSRSSWAMPLTIRSISCFCLFLKFFIGFMSLKWDKKNEKDTWRGKGPPAKVWWPCPLWWIFHALHNKTKLFNTGSMWKLQSGAFPTPCSHVSSKHKVDNRLGLLSLRWMKEKSLEAEVQVTWWFLTSHNKQSENRRGEQHIVAGSEVSVSSVLKTFNKSDIQMLANTDWSNSGFAGVK